MRQVVSGQVSPEQAQAVEQHVDVCVRCRRLAAQVVREGSTDRGNGAELPALLLEPGQALGRYVALELVGAGAMSVVYSAYDSQLDRHVALKLLRADALRQPGDDAVARLTAEAQAIARVSHPQVVTIHELGLFQGQLFIAMEYLPGGTLEAWLLAAPRGWREILERFAAAGEGLQAAHTAGLVHRDFKPSNVLLGADGGIRVTDFGLASIATARGQSATGLVGTPGYMSPEQLAGKPADAQSDQFSFCVALYEALVGARPYTAATVEGLAAAMQHPARWPKKTGVPRWVGKLVTRGLSRDPAARFVSMQQLVEALRSHPPAIRQRRGIAISIAVVLVAAALFVSTRAESRCAAGVKKLEGAWDEQVKAKIHGAFVATNKPYAERMFTLGRDALERFSAGWVQTYQQVCEGTWVRGDQSEELLDARMRCLEERRLALGALTATLAKADGAVVERALVATGNLEPAESCGQLQSSHPPTPQTPAQRAEQTALLLGLGETRALLDTGQFAAAKTRAKEQAEGAVKLSSDPLQAEALLLLARVQQKTGEAPAAEEALFRAIALCEGTGAPLTLARAWVNLVWVQGYLLAQGAAAHHSASVAQAVLHRLGPQLDLEADLQNGIASTLRVEGRLVEAEAAYRQALELRQRARGADDPLVATAWGNLASLLEMTGNDEASLAAHQKALALLEQRPGPDHPDYATELNNVALVQQNRANFAGALELFERALAIRERALGPQHPVVATSAGNLCLLLVQMKRVDDALVQCRRAVKIAAVNPGTRHPFYASASNSLGTALLAHGDLEEARTSFEEALRVREATVGPSHPGCAYDLVGLGQAALLQKHPDQAVAFFRRALTLRESPPINAKLRTEAQTWLDRAVAAAPHR